MSILCRTPHGIPSANRNDLHARWRLARHGLQIAQREDTFPPTALDSHYDAQEFIDILDGQHAHFIALSQRTTLLKLRDFGVERAGEVLPHDLLA